MFQTVAFSPFSLYFLVSCLALLLTSPAQAGDIRQINHLVVIYAENHSFDNLYGLFPGAEGIAQADAEHSLQIDHDGSVLKNIKVFNHHGQPDPALPVLPNAPFRIDADPVNRQPSSMVPSPVHAFFHNQEQINGGLNNRFVAMSNTGGWVMGHYDGSQFKLWQWAKGYTLADHFFMAAFGGSYLNHQWLICACTPVHPDAPASMRIQLDEHDRLLKTPDSPPAHTGAVKVFSGGSVQVTPDGFSVNTSQPPYQPSGIPPSVDGSRQFADEQGMVYSDRLQIPLPPQTQTTIGDLLSGKGISWAWYAGGFAQALEDGIQEPSEKRKVIYNADKGSPNFQPHHQPFNFYARYAPGTAERAAHLKDGTDFLHAIEQGTLPTVSFYKPAGRDSQHPSYTDLVTGDTHISEVLDKLKRSPQWPHMLVVVTYDENGGYWDHVPPPNGPGWSDRFGPGTRIPALFIGPSVKKGFVDKTVYDTTSILKFISERFDLPMLPGVRLRMGNFSELLE